MSKPKGSTRRTPHSPLGLVLAFAFSTGLGIGLAQWQPQWFPLLWGNHTPPSGKRFVLASNRLFFPVEATLRQEALPLLDQIAQSFPPNPRSHVRVVSYSRSVDTPQESLNLSYRRALAVESYLRSKTNNDRYYWFASAVASSEPEEERLEIIISP
ncbi:MAG: hypothetical protein RMK91_11750 [Pseudanabaenaceae cyanobacterium SKYGB_i_bin29]|nr:hypothetical protein [Pseudanabaenaceae cyanobacterium SKYG29]MDW8422527.1 hypothetical protein [Pseudanabaenaceae cyanobacterium SKYGB_i_bin29]